MRKYLIAGNWKMNKNAAESAALVEEIVKTIGNETSVSVVVCPPYTSIQAVVAATSNSNIETGAQNMYFEKSGAYTGEISAEMLRHLRVDWVILGHSERRAIFGETDALINKKVKVALENSLKPILCVGETIEEREAGDTLKVVETQLTEGLRDIDESKAEEVVIAYEPVWAIGTGKTATPEMAQEVHAYIRKLLNALFGEVKGEKIRILYGGSMKPDNADELLAKKDIDGGLIGGASLQANPFMSLVESAKKLS
jgi:triosephosphate isomerase (TIM)